MVRFLFLILIFAAFSFDLLSQGGQGQEAHKRCNELGLSDVPCPSTSCAATTQTCFEQNGVLWKTSLQCQSTFIGEACLVVNGEPGKHCVNRGEELCPSLTGCRPDGLTPVCNQLSNQGCGTVPTASIEECGK